MTLNASSRRRGEARERAGAADSVHRQSSEHSSCAWKMSTSVITRGLCVLEARDVKIELVPWIEHSNDSEGEVGIEIIGFG